MRIAGRPIAIAVHSVRLVPFTVANEAIFFYLFVSFFSFCVFFLLLARSFSCGWLVFVSTSRVRVICHGANIGFKAAVDTLVKWFFRDDLRDRWPRQAEQNKQDCPRIGSSRFGWSTFTAPGSTIGSNPVKIGLNRFGWQNGKSRFTAPGSTIGSNPVEIVVNPKSKKRDSHALFVRHFSFLFKQMFRNQGPCRRATLSFTPLAAHANMQITATSSGK